MRNHIKKQLADIIGQLQKANQAVFGQIGKVELVTIQNMLADCQDSAVAIGQRIEAEEGEGTHAVELLEKYCEELYMLCVNWAEPSKAGNNAIQIQELLQQAKDSILKELPEPKREIVFLPYKACMWDSLESVWMKACEDAQCIAHVIPIPYFDKMPDGSIGQMHYEGADFPDYVPITDWRQYSLEAHHPDQIYIHNPYDQYNNVTTIHPSFYSSELKKYTDELIYIPYFVCWDDVPEHFCTTLGVFNADKVILQSAKVADTYKRVYMEVMGEEQKKKEAQTGKNDPGFWEALQKKADEKFLPLGSPKFDKVRRTTREDAEKTLPEDWRQKIYRKDSSGAVQRKKVLLYNTNVQALLDHQEQAIVKMKWVFEMLKKDPKVVLWWRPHPLNDSTLEAMLPEIEKEYFSLIEAYKREGWGIYDDTPDLNRAIAVSDAYYGDGGSVPALFRETGKPIMFQNFTITD